MTTGLFRCAAAVLFASAALVGGCGGGGSASSVLLAGDWSGTMSISYLDDGSSGGALKLSLDQQGDFISGVATWDPVGKTQSIAGPINGTKFTLLLNFKCSDQAVDATLAGSFDGTTLQITSGSGKACSGGGTSLTVSGASGSLTHTSDNAPL